MDFTGWLVFEVTPWVMFIEMLVFIPLQWMYGNELIPGASDFPTESDITNRKAELAAAKAELDALKEESWRLNS